MGGQFQDKVVVVTGASAEGGIGWHCAERFAEEGARVIVAARSLDGLQALASKIGGTVVQCDIAKETDVARVAATAVAMGGLDVAVNAAGQSVSSTCDSFDQQTLEAAMAVNFYGNLYFFRHMAGAMARGGSIVAVASVAATMVVPGQLLYGSAKAATITAMKYAALEYAPRQIRVNALVPGLVNTQMIAPLIASKELLQIFMKEVPLKRIADPVEIANAALWLSASPSITGTTVTIDGGNGLRRAPQPEEFASLAA